MKKKIRNWIVALCGIILLSSNAMGITAQAKENDSLVLREYQELTGDNVEYGINDFKGNSNSRAPILSGCTIGISVDASGVTVSMTTSATEMASELGVKNIYLEYKDNLGIWHRINSSPLHGWRYNDNHYGSSFTYKSVEKGVYYRATCTHYAYLSDGYHHLDNYTKGVCY